MDWNLSIPVIDLKQSLPSRRAFSGSGRFSPPQFGHSLLVIGSVDPVAIEDKGGYQPEGNEQRAINQTETKKALGGDLSNRGASGKGRQVQQNTSKNGPECPGRLAAEGDRGQDGAFRTAPRGQLQWLDEIRDHRTEKPS